MLEVELKFQIAESRRNALVKALDPKKANLIQLQAKYFDTPDRRLAQHAIALRQRREDHVWIQTLKAQGANHLERIEHNMALGASEHAPALDLTVYTQHPEIALRLQHALADQTEQLQLQFETDIERLQRVVEFEDALIEISLDRGEIRSQQATQAVYEVEFELKQGSTAALLNFCFEWVKKYQLWLDVRSKAEIGNLLATQSVVSPATTAQDFIFNKKSSPDHNLRALVAAQLQHLLPNIAAIAADLATPDHIHQAYQALDQLHLSLSIFADWSSAVSDKWSYQLAAFKQHFENLAHVEHMQQTLGALLQNPKTAANLDQDVLYAKQKLVQLVKSTQNVQHYLELYNFSLAPALSHTQDLKNCAATTLQRQYKALQDALQQVDLEHLESLHVLAEALQHLQYSFPRLTTIYDVKNLQKYGKALNDAHQAAEQFHILSTSAQYLQQTELEASDWFALGWLTAKQENYAQQLLDATEQFLVSRKFIKA
ncbi:CYTH domain-containing protein [Acinetobacter larvae]|uniref:CYTH domain-containing protein n=1 Tax=Acinetobacter larvae TaxID=1789224 RepID=A0A1B2M1D5_9GAMM|nr:CYTH domain-containing protein [Acinetobacter larvae]AOA59007.1 CYTH domain-containing protein [Acinetobacter larvae]